MALHSHDSNTLIKRCEIKKLIDTLASEGKIPNENVQEIWDRIDGLNDDSVLPLTTGQLRVFVYEDECGIIYVSPEGDIADVMMASTVVNPNSISDIVCYTYEDAANEDPTRKFYLNSKELAQSFGSDKPES